MAASSSARHRPAAFSIANCRRRRSRWRLPTKMETRRNGAASTPFLLAPSPNGGASSSTDRNDDKQPSPSEVAASALSPTSQGSGRHLPDGNQPAVPTAARPASGSVNKKTAAAQAAAAARAATVARQSGATARQPAAAAQAASSQPPPPMPPQRTMSAEDAAHAAAATAAAEVPAESTASIVPATMPDGSAALTVQLLRPDRL